MHRRAAWTIAALLILGWLTLGDHAWALIIRLTPLREVLTESHFIFTAKVDKLDADRPAAVLTVDEDLKGKFPFRRMPVNLTGDAEAKKLKHVPELLKRLKPELPLVLFANQTGKRYTVFACTNGTWFQMIGQKTDGSDTIVWAFTHCEPYFRRTFKGTTAELRQVVVDGLSGKTKPPEPDAKEPPGLGPEIEPKREARSAEREVRSAPRDARAARSALRAPRSALFAIIAPLGVGGPLAILALLFPSLFGGVFVLFKRWLAFFTVISLDSTLYLVHWAWGSVLFGNTRWASDAALWLMLTVVTLGGTLWAWWRHLPRPGEQPTEVGGRIEHVVLWLLSLTCLTIVIIVLLDPPKEVDASWPLFLVFAIALWVSTIYRLIAAILPRSTSGSRPALPTEGIILWTAMVAFVGYAALRPGLARNPGTITTGGSDARNRPLARLVKDSFVSVLFTEQRKGVTFSTPQIVGDRAYLATAHTSVFERAGAVYCLDLATQKVLWKFDDDTAMKHVFSSPVVADGRLYIGEGFHQDDDCHLYCVDAHTGKKIWSFKTNSHTEATPLVANGKVYIGAGDDGVYCLDAKTGKKIWQFPDPKGEKELHLHVDSTPALVGNRLYFGGGFDEDLDLDDKKQSQPAICCVDADTGKKIWLERTPKSMVRKMDGSKHHVPAWGSPTVDGGLVFIGLGTVRINFVSEKYDPVGALWCVEAATGKEAWICKVGNGVLAQPAIDQDRVYFGSRDHHVYCVDRFDGRIHWKNQLDGEITSSPTLSPCSACGQSTNVYVTSKSSVLCLDLETGKPHWTYDLAPLNADLYGTPVVRVAHGPEGDRRHIFFSANLHDAPLQNPFQGSPGLCYLKDLLPKR